MTQTANILATATAPLSLALLILPQASILEVASVLDPMRAANRHLGSEGFRWRILSPDGAAVPLTCGIELPAQGDPGAARGMDALMVVAGFAQADVATRPLIREVRRLAPGLGLVGGIDAGPWVLARAGLLDGHRATVHWEDLEDLAAAHPAVTVVPDRFVIDRARATAGGAAPAQDLMLHIIACRHGKALARQVAASFLTTARPGSEPQIAAADATLDPRVAVAVARMEARIETPEPAAATAAALGLSPRRLEGLFRDALGTTPGAYALSLRLAAARRMVTDTRHPLAEVALRCGFSSPATFARAFRVAFGQSPSGLRRG